MIGGGRCFYSYVSFQGYTCCRLQPSLRWAACAWLRTMTVVTRTSCVRPIESWFHQQGTLQVLIKDAQSEVSRVYLGGFVGQAVSGALWLASAALATWQTPKTAILLLVFGGFFIYPLTSAALRICGRPAALSRGNPLRWLAMQAAFVLPASMPLVAPVAMYRLNLFFPATAILLGAHYLPFATLYGKRSFVALGAALVVCGIAIGLYLPGASFGLAGWVAGAILLVFAVVEYAEWRHSAQLIVQADAQKVRAA